MTPVSNEDFACHLSMDAGRLRKPEETQSSSAGCALDQDISVSPASFLQKRAPIGPTGPRRISADFGSPRTFFIKSFLELGAMP